MSPVNKKLAAGATLAALGGLTAVAIGQPGSTETKKAAAAPVEIRTETIQKTVRVVRHEKPKHKHVRTPAAPAVAPRRVSAAPPPAPVTPAASAGSAPAYSAPAPRQVASVRPPVRVPSHHPVTTRTSGSSGASGGKGGDDGGERSDRHGSAGGDD
jgi:hypothetical protein